MRFWIIVGCAVLVLAAAIWPVGKKADEPTSPPLAVHMPSPPPTPAKPEPAKVIEVLDLSRAYEPVREPEPITPATYIELLPEPERIDVMPREVPEEPTGVVNPASHIQVPDRPRRIPEAVVDEDEIEVKVVNGSGTFYERIDPVQRLDVMPRLLPTRFVIEQPDGRLLHYLETETDAVVRVPHGHSPAADHLTHPIPRKAFTVPLIPVEYLTVAPRPHVVIHREEQERQTGLREDDFVGQIGP